MKLSIVIVSWNVKDDLLRCLRSIKENRPCSEFEVIVVDNASTDGTVEAAVEGFPGTITIVNSENRGFAAANNQGIKRSCGDYILLLNPDTIVHPHSLDNLTKTLDKTPTVGACGPKIVDKDGIISFSVGIPPGFRATLYAKTFLRSLGVFRKYHKIPKSYVFDYTKQADVEQLSGAVLMVRRAVIREIGLLDENFFMYYEDTDLCFRIRKAGWKIVYVPESLFTHLGGRSSAQVSAKKSFMVYSSLLTYFRKHRGRHETTFFSLIFKVGVVIKYIFNIFLSTATFLISVLLFNRRRRLKSLAKIKNSVNFLTRYSWRLLLKRRP